MKTKIHKSLHIGKKVIHLKLMLLILMILPLAVFTLLTSKSTFIAGIRSMVVLSGSMAPFIPTGSVVYIKPEKNYRKGDVITFTTGDITVTHRIVGVKYGKNGQEYKTKGDANSSLDKDLVLQENVLGKSVFSLSYLGYVINYLKQPQGFLLLVLAPTLLFIGLELWNIKKEIEKSVEKKVLERLKIA